MQLQASVAIFIQLRTVTSALNLRGATVKARTAVFIDCENVPAKFWPEIEARATALGYLNLCRLYGDFTGDRLSRWLDIAREHCLQPVLQLGGKNAADIAMTIAGMDLLHQGKTEAVVLVSSDQDLSPLAHRLRAGGIKVVGLGVANTPAALRKACSEFFELGQPMSPGVVPKPAPQKQPPAPKPVAVKAA